MIVKVQLPQVSNDPDPKALVYAEGRIHLQEMPITKDLQQKMKKRPKVFFEAELKDGTFEIGQEAPWQNW